MCVSYIGGRRFGSMLIDSFGRAGGGSAVDKEGEMFPQPGYLVMLPALGVWEGVRFGLI